MYSRIITVVALMVVDGWGHKNYAIDGEKTVFVNVSCTTNLTVQVHTLKSGELFLKQQHHYFHQVPAA
jgi:hypothetical protein